MEKLLLTKQSVEENSKSSFAALFNNELAEPLANTPPSINMHDEMKK